MINSDTDCLQPLESISTHSTTVKKNHNPIESIESITELTRI